MKRIEITEYKIRDFTFTKIRFDNNIRVLIYQADKTRVYTGNLKWLLGKLEQEEIEEKDLQKILNYSYLVC